MKKSRNVVARHFRDIVGGVDEDVCIWIRQNCNRDEVVRETGEDRRYR